MHQDAVSDDVRVPNSVEDFPLFFGDGIFGVLHHPSCAVRSGWVICNPFGMEKTNSHRLNFEWARALASAGHWVLRFDYRGTGDSAGAFEGSTIHDYIDDIGKAVAELERLSGVPCKGLAGLRLGAGLAAIFAARTQLELDLVMWEPVIDGRKYRDSLLRTAMANELVNSGGLHKSRNDLRRELEAGRPVSVDGFALTAPMYDSLETLDLVALGRPTSAPVSVSQINSRSGRPPRPAFVELVRAYSKGGDARLETVQAPSMWLRTKSYRWRQDELFGKTLAWIRKSQSRFFDNSGPVTTMPGSIEVTGSIERPVGFDVAGERVWGILHDPQKPRKDAPTIVMVAAGALCRSGIFYTRLARDFASAGWRVLRFDPRGLGDSNGHFDYDSVDEVYCKIDAGALVPDTLAALDFLSSECCMEASILMGLCGGGTTSIEVAAIDNRVVSVAPLELPLKLCPFPGPTNHHQRADRNLWVDRVSRRRGTLLLLTIYRIARTAKSNVRRLRVILSKVLNLWSGSTTRNHSWFRERIGEDANISMLAAFQVVLAKRLPVYCIYADSPDAQLFELALPGLLREEGGDAPAIEHLIIPGNDHVLTIPGQSEELSRSLLAWLDSEPWAGVNHSISQEASRAEDYHG